MLHIDLGALREHSETLLLALTIATALLLLLGIILAFSVQRSGRRLKALMRGADSLDLETVLNRHMTTVEATVRRMDALEQAVAVLQAQMPSSLRRATLVRYDAFADVGGEQSFSLALLDAQGNGVILSSVYSRMDVRVYAKSIQNGRSSHTLSAEEERALKG